MRYQALKKKTFLAAATFTGIAVLFPVLCMAASENDVQTYTDTDFAMDTVVSETLYTTGEDITADVIEALKKEFDVPVSLDTYKSGVAKAGIEAGADLINDIWGLKWDGTMAAVLAETGVASCLMHNRKDTDYKDYLNDVVADLDETMKMAKEAGIKKETIMLDPGIGFAKDLDQNLELMNHLELLNQWDVPVLLGTSRKSMIGLTLDLPSDQRVEGTVATTVSGYMKGCRFFRVHDVKENMRAMKMIEAICAK